MGLCKNILDGEKFELSLLLKFCKKKASKRAKVTYFMINLVNINQIFEMFFV